MRHRIPLLLIFLGFAPVARAQVTLDLRALDKLPVARAVPAPHRAVVRVRPSRPAASVPRALPHKAAVVSRAAPPSGAPLGLPPGAPPAVTAAAPAAAAPAALPSAPPGLPAVAPPAPAAALATAPPSPPAAPPPLRLAFAPGAGFLTPAQVRTVGAFARALPATAASYDILAYAPASPQNPSAARRLALARALAVHDALRAAGVPASRIRLRAMAPGAGGGNDDRADLRVRLSGSSP